MVLVENLQYDIENNDQPAKLEMLESVSFDKKVFFYYNLAPLQ